nr:hypothetical protein [Burkholderia dolosa]
MIASVLVLVTRPAATFWIRRSEPTFPTLTTPADELAAANVPTDCPAIVLLTVPVPPVVADAAPLVTAPEPIAAEFATVDVAPAPSAIEPPPDAVAPFPSAMSFAVAGEPLTPATAFVPCAIALFP